MPNQWLSHVADFRKANPTVNYKDALKAAKATYKQPVAPPPQPEPVVEVPVKKVKAKKASQM